MKDPTQALTADEHRDQAYALAEAGRWEEAMSACDDAIPTVEAFLADLFHLRGIALEELDRPEEVLAAYLTAIRLDADRTDVARDLFELEVELGHGREMVTVRTFSFAGLAHAARAYLAAEGIQAFVFDDGMVGANWLNSRAVGGVKVKVRQGDAERALQVLASAEEKAAQGETGEGEAYEALETCPACGSTNVRYQHFDRRLAFATQLLLRVPLPFLKRTWHCQACGHEWKGKAGEG